MPDPDCGAVLGNNPELAVSLRGSFGPLHGIEFDDLLSVIGMNKPDVWLSYKLFLGISGLVKGHRIEVREPPPVVGSVYTVSGAFYNLPILFLACSEILFNLSPPVNFSSQFPVVLPLKKELLSFDGQVLHQCHYHSLHCKPDGSKRDTAPYLTPDPHGGIQHTLLSRGKRLPYRFLHLRSLRRERFHEHNGSHNPVVIESFQRMSNTNAHSKQ